LALAAGLSLLLAAASAVAANRAERHLAYAEGERTALQAALSDLQRKRQRNESSAAGLAWSIPLLGWGSWTAASLAAAVPTARHLRGIQLQWDPPLDAAQPMQPRRLRWHLELVPEAKGDLSRLLRELERDGLRMGRVGLEQEASGVSGGNRSLLVISGVFDLGGGG
jgi:hypothetical protein